MAVFGIGAAYGGRHDMTRVFLENGVACVGWSEGEAPALHAMMRTIKPGSTIFIKAQRPGEPLAIKAIGIVTGKAVDGVVLEHRFGSGVGEIGVPVAWLWSGDSILVDADSKYNVRLNTLFEEFDPAVIKAVLGKIPVLVR